VVADFISNADLVGETIATVDRLIDDIRDIPSTATAVRRLVEGIQSSRLDPAGWPGMVTALRSDELGRLLRTDPMVRRCQWRQNGADAYDIVEAYVMDWGDAADSLIEAEAPGPTVNAVFLAMGMGAAVRERRTMLHGFLAAASRDARILGLGAGRSPELAMLAPTGPLDVAQWVIADDDPSEDAMHRRSASPRVERRVERPADALAASAAKNESFDVIYAVDAFDGMTDGEAVALIEQAAALLAPNGRLVISAFASDLPEAAYLDAVLDWRPRLRDEALLGQLLARGAPDTAFARTVWRGGSNRVVFGSIERQSWAA
jgi:SAM-dependent methyltransferase